LINQNKLLAKIAVFDSGLGSLSIIKEIQKNMKADIVYFADQKNYPYGNKSQAQIASIIKKTINLLEKKFTPDIIVVASFFFVLFVCGFATVASLRSPYSSSSLEVIFNTQIGDLVSLATTRGLLPVSYTHLRAHET